MKVILNDGTTVLNAICDKDGTITIANVVDFTIPKENVQAVILDSIEEFDKIFKPIQSPSGEGCFYFETYGKEYEAVLAAHKENLNIVWTVIDGEDGEMYVAQGWHYVNRVHYIITENPAHWFVEDFRYCDN